MCRIIRYAALMAIALALVSPRIASAQYPLTRHEAYSPITVENPVPGNDLVVAQPVWEESRDMDSFGYSFSLLKQLSPKASIDVSSQWTQTRPHHGKDEDDFTFVDLLPFYQVFGSYKHSFILAAATDFHIATGGPAGAGADDTTRIGPSLLWAKGMGDLSNSGWGRYMRPLLVQGDVEYLFDTSHNGKQHPSAGVALSYSIPFMKSHVTWLPLRFPISDLIPVVELHYDQVVLGNDQRTPPVFQVMPGLAILTRKYQITLGVQLPLNHYTTNENQVAVIGLVDIFYDVFFPKLSAYLF